MSTPIKPASCACVIFMCDADVLITGGYLSECLVERSDSGAISDVRLLEAAGVSRTIGFDD